MSDVDFLVIGAGQAGLAAARRLQRSCADFLLVDAAPAMGIRDATMSSPICSAMPIISPFPCGWQRVSRR